MFWHDFKNSLTVLVRNRMLIFWVLVFPLLMAGFFKMAFSRIIEDESLAVINIAVVDDEEFQKQPYFKAALEQASAEGDEQIFDTQYVDAEKAIELLKKDEIDGYVAFSEGKPKITVRSSGVNETVLRFVVDEISSGVEIGPGYATAVGKVVDESNSRMDYTLIEFFTVIAMTCISGGTISMFVTQFKLANAGKIGRRIAVSPVGKFNLLFGGLVAAFVAQILGVALLLVFIRFVLGIDFGSNWPGICLLSVCGSLAGLTLGVACATLIRGNDGLKVAILTGGSTLGCFLCGMMGVTMKYVVDTNLPILNIVNPCNMVTDGFYAMYYYEAPERFFFNIASLLIFSVVLFGISFLSLRRQQYDNL